MVSDLSTIIITGRLDELKQQAAALNSLPVAVSFTCSPFALPDLKEILFYYFGEDRKVPFSITIDFSGAANGVQVSREWTDTLCLLLAHLKYQKRDNRHVLYTSGCTAAFQLAMDDLLRQLSLQGYSQVAVQHLDANAQHNGSDNRLLVIPEWKEDAFPWFYSLYRANVVYTRLPLPVIAKGNAVPMGALLQCREKADRKIEQEEPHLYFAIREIRRCAAELIQAKHSLKLTAEDLKSKKDYIDYLLGKVRVGNDEDFEFTDMVRLKRYYQNEYEILPLWYKQFGHVIKVIMGKRSFRSLYRDDVKKYR